MFIKNFVSAISRLTVVLLLSVPLAAQAGIAVIANKSNTQHAVTKKVVAEIYLGKIKHLSNGQAVRPVDHPRGSAIRKKFNKVVLGMTERELNRYWAKRKYTGKAKPPVYMNSDEEIRDWVASNPDAIGYIDGTSLNNRVKVLLILP